MIDFLDNIDAEMSDGGARVVPIITEIHEVGDSLDIHGNKAEDIPILPLRNMVLYPMMTMPVSVGREKSMRLIKEAEQSHCSIAVFCQYDSRIDDPLERDLNRVGTIASIIKVLELPDGSTNVILLLEKTLESPLDCKEIQPVHPKGGQSWVFIGRTDIEAETPIIWPPDVKS